MKQIQLYLLLFVVSTTIIMSCGLPGPQTTSVTFPSIKQIHAAVSGEDDSLVDGDDYGLISIQGRSINEKYFFQRTFDSHRNNIDDLVFELPNDKWIFYGVGWVYSTSGQGILSYHCFVSDVVELQGIEKNQEILISDSECKNYQQGTEEELTEVAIVNYMTDSRGSRSYGSNNSVRISIVDIPVTQMDDLNLSADYQSQKYLWNNLNSKMCISFEEDAKLSIPIPKNQSSPRPLYFLIEGFLDKNCEIFDSDVVTGTSVTASGDTATIVGEARELFLNTMIGENYNNDTTPLFLTQSAEVLNADSTPEYQLIWLTSKKSAGQRCVSPSNCVSNNCDTTSNICLENSTLDDSDGAESSSDSSGRSSSSGSSRSSAALTSDP